MAFNEATLVGVAGVALACAFAYFVWVLRGLGEKAIIAYVQVRTQPARADATPVELPKHILSMIYELNDDWARESVSARARELYADIKDWGMVAHQLQQEGGLS